MIWVTVGIVLGIYVSIYLLNEFCDKLITKVLNALWLAPLGIVCGSLLTFAVLSLPLGLLGTLIFPSEEIVVSENAIYSVSENFYTGGHFVLGTGNTDGDVCFCYVIETPQGKKVEIAKAESTTIVEDNSQTPNAVVKSGRYEWKWLNIVFLDVRTIFDDFDETILTVPENTVIQSYSIDLK